MEKIDFIIIIIVVDYVNSVIIFITENKFTFNAQYKGLFIIIIVECKKYLGQRVVIFYSVNKNVIIIYVAKYKNLILLLWSKKI